MDEKPPMFKHKTQWTSLKSQRDFSRLAMEQKDKTLQTELDYK